MDVVMEGSRLTCTGLLWNLFKFVPAIFGIKLNHIKLLLKTLLRLWIRSDNACTFLSNAFSRKKRRRFTPNWIRNYQFMEWIYDESSFAVPERASSTAAKIERNMPRCILRGRNPGPLAVARGRKGSSSWNGEPKKPSGIRLHVEQGMEY